LNPAVFFILFLLSTPVRAVDSESVETMRPLRVEDMREKLERTGKLKNTIIKTEVVSESKMEKKQAKNLTEAVANETGVDAASGCSICGIKRIQINGLKGEYTTVLVDDIPIHSTVSSFYGMDAISTAGLSRVEIARGAGASLLAPGALGGVLNIVTKKATENGLWLDTSGGNADYRLFTMVGTLVNKSGTQRTTVSAEHQMQGQWDSDGNGVNESPLLKNYSLSARFSDDLSARNNIDVRGVIQRSDVFGGPIFSANTDQKALPVSKIIGTAGGTSFVDGDVRKAYNGNPAATLESVNSERYEGTAKWTHLVSDTANFSPTLSYARQSQNSFYEGNDYANVDHTLYGDLRFNYTLSPTNLLTFGSDGRYETLRSQSATLFVGGNPKDDFNSLSAGAYLQDVWNVSPAVEISAALRLDKLNVNWTEQVKVLDEIDKLVLVPRLHVRWKHNPSLTSRFSLGQGYRAPLTFFESEHGILNNGFSIQVTDIERSTAASYSLGFDNKRTTATLSAAWTNLSNVASVDVNQSPSVLSTSPGVHNLLTADAVAGYQLFSWLMIGAGYEHFFYPDSYKSILPLAAIEDRARIMLDADGANWSWNLTGTLVGARNLEPYGYGGRYNVVSTTGALSSPKLTNAPAFFNIDTKFSWKISKVIALYTGVKNLLGFTQSQVENPLFWSQTPTGTQYNVVHIWGPSRGREIYLGMTATF
jgi:outer membrane receptor for ferrienterochelin and colicin